MTILQEKSLLCNPFWLPYRLTHCIKRATVALFHIFLYDHKRPFMSSHMLKTSGWSLNWFQYRQINSENQNHTTILRPIYFTKLLVKGRSYIHFSVCWEAASICSLETMHKCQGDSKAVLWMNKVGGTQELVPLTCKNASIKPRRNKLKMSTQVFKQQSLQGCPLHSSSCKMNSQQPTSTH